MTQPLARSSVGKVRPRPTDAHSDHEEKPTAAAAAGTARPGETGARSSSDPAPRQRRNTGERARILQEYAALQRGLVPPVKRQRHMAKVDAKPPPAAASSAIAASGEQDQEEDGQTASAASTPVGSAAAVEDTAPATKAVEAAEKAAIVAAAQEEKELDGAPEGELFLVSVLSSEEIQPSTDLEKELQDLDDLLTALEGDTAPRASVTSAADEDAELSWGKQYYAVDSIRRLTIHHADEARQRLSRALSLLVLPSVSSLRSAMSRNALLCVQDIVQLLPSDVTVHFDSIVPLLVQRACNEKQFIRDIAKDVLDSTTRVTTDGSLLASLLKVSSDKNPQAVSVAGVYAARCILAMDSDQLRTFANETDPTMLEELGSFLNCKVVECKVQTRRGLQHIRKTLGDGSFVAIVKAQLSGGVQLDVLKASEQRKKAARNASGGRPSIRERMQQMKKFQEASGLQDPSKDVPVLVVTDRAVADPVAPTNAPPSL